MVFFSLMSFSQETSDKPMNGFWNNPKLNLPEAVLADFIEGKSTTRVIVNLEKAKENAMQDIKKTGTRHQLQNEVHAAQDRVMNALDPNHIRITNRFSYIFGFSAEVTQEGLQELVDNPDVFSIDEDTIIEAQTAQGIPLMNAYTASSFYDGSGMAIAICDTGIDYTHPRLGNGGFPNNKVIGGYDTGQDDADPMDRQGHGTACAGIAAGNLGMVYCPSK
jgi:subtilisin family serine protease